MSGQPPETACHDQGGWTSGPSITTGQVTAEQVRAGDRLAHDGRVIEITDVRSGEYWFPLGREQGVAIGWKSGSSSGLLFRRASDLLERVMSQP